MIFQYLINLFDTTDIELINAFGITSCIKQVIKIYDSITEKKNN